MKNKKLIIGIIILIIAITVATSYYIKNNNNNNTQAKIDKEEAKYQEDNPFENKQIIIELEKSSLNIGETTTVTISSKEEIKSPVNYVSSNPEVATINNNGLITALSEGTTTITATVGDYKDEATIEVKDVTNSNAKTNNPCSKGCSKISNKTKIAAINLKDYKPFITVNNDIFRDGQSMTVTDKYIVLASITTKKYTEKLLKYNKISQSQYDKYINEQIGKARINVYQKDKSYTKNDEPYKHYTKKMGHANGMAYNPKTNKILIVAAQSNTNTTLNNTTVKKDRVYYYFDSSFSSNSLSAKRDGFLDSNNNYTNVTGIAYDNNKYYLSGGSEIKIFDISKKRVVSTFKKATGSAEGYSGYSNQDIGGHDGKILHIRYSSSSHAKKENFKKCLNGTSLFLSQNNECPRNAIDIYSTEGKYLGSYVFYGKGGYELESVAHYSGNTYALYFNHTNVSIKDSNGKKVSIRSPYSYVYLIDLNI